MELYQSVANLTESAECGKSYKNKLFAVRNKKKIKSIHCLCVNSVKKKKIIDELLLKAGVSDITWLKRVILYELLWGRRQNILNLKSNAVVDEIIKHHRAILKHLHHNEKEKKMEGEEGIPRYIRINLEKVTSIESEEILKKNNFKKIPCPDTYEGFLQHTKLLNNNEYMLDFHIPNLIVFSHNAKLQKLHQDTFIRQDKASCLVVPLLAPLPGSCIVDMCAAPGFKTQHAACFISKLGKIYSIDINKERFLTLCKTIKQYNLEDCCVAMNEDALKVNEEICPNVEYIILDAPCSGTGMSNTLIKHVASEDRLKKLHNLQVMLLKYALNTFLCVRRIVYSTCSVTEEENEGVVSECLEVAREQGFRLVPLASAFKGSFHTGIGNYPCSPHVLRTSPDSDLTNGFFIALFERSIPPKHPNWSYFTKLNNVSTKHSDQLDEYENRTENVIDELSVKNQKNSKRRRRKKRKIEHTDKNEVSKLENTNENNAKSKLALKANSGVTEKSTEKCKDSVFNKNKGLVKKSKLIKISKNRKKLKVLV